MLVRARSLCLTKECDPARWFAFRRRAYHALKDARQYPGVPLSLLISLQEVLHASVTPPIAYTLTRVLQQKGEGLTARLKKKRAHRSFRSAPLSEELRALCARHLECHES